MKILRNFKKKYTGAINKRKWIITNKEILKQYFEKCNYKPSILALNLNVSYATCKRFLCEAGLWELAKLKNCRGGGRKRTTLIDKFGYKYADSKYDYKNERGEIIRRLEHHVIAEEKVGRKLKDNELVHHINLDKKDNRPENLFICENNNQHRLIHCHLETIAGEAVKAGIIKFDHYLGCYYLDNKVAVYE